MKFEYLVKVVSTVDAQTILNFWGDDGWELITSDEAQPGHLYCIFKRPKSNVLL